MPTTVERPRASVLLPVRDGEPWLEESLASVLAQTEAGFEVVAVDDASVDGSRALLDAAAARDGRVRVVEGPGHGVAAALNRGLAACRAPVVVRMDADDRMHPRRLEVQLAALDADPTLFAVSCRAVAFPDEETGDGMRAYVDWQNGLLDPAEIARDRFVESPVLHPTLAARTGVLRRRLRGWSARSWPEDWDFLLRAFEQGLRIARVPEVLHDWRQHAGQLTRTHADYGAGSLLELRATFLARHLRVAAGQRPVWVLGAGPVGKALVKALAARDVVAAGLADVDPRKIGGVVRGQGGRWSVVDHASLRDRAPRPFAVSAVAGSAARARVRAELLGWGWREGADFVVAA